MSEKNLLSVSQEPTSEKILRVCLGCGKNENENKFRLKAKKCTRCYSKKNNETLKSKDYYKKYYLDHSEGRKRQVKSVKVQDDNLSENLNP